MTRSESSGYICSGATVALWGQRAKDFDDEYVYEKGQKNPVPILFVGVLMKRYGRRSLKHSLYLSLWLTLHKHVWFVYT